MYLTSAGHVFYTGSSQSTIGTERMRIKNDGTVGIGTSSPTAGLEITTTSTQTLADYGFILFDTITNIISMSYASGASNIEFGLRVSGRILCTNGEIDITSDIRIKKEINLLTNKYCKDFIIKTNPVTFKYSNTEDNQLHHGYIAQDIIKAGYNDLVTQSSHPGLPELIDSDNFLSPKDNIFVMCYDEIIPILAKNISIIYEENEILEDKISNLENTIQDIKQENEILKITINTILNRLSILENN
jgi:hypothetical protein